MWNTATPREERVESNVEKRKSSRREPARIILAACAVALGAGALYRLEWMPAVLAQPLQAGARFLAQPIGVPLWLVVLLGLCGAFVLLAVTARMLASRMTVAGWREYRRDRLMGVLWTWTYNADDAIADLASHCAQCEGRVHAEPGRGSHSTEFSCHACGHVAQVPGYHADELKAAVVAILEQKLRNHAWGGALVAARNDAAR